MDGSRIYQNPSAETVCWPYDSPPASFEVIDHLGRVVARLGTIQN